MKMKIKKTSICSVPVDYQDQDCTLVFDRPFVGEIHLSVRKMSEKQVILRIQMDGVEYV